MDSSFYEALNKSVALIEPSFSCYACCSLLRTS